MSKKTSSPSEIKAKTLKTVLVFVEMENGNVHQVLASETEKEAALDTLRTDGTLRITEETIGLEVIH